MAYIGTKPTIGNFQICDAISVVNGQAAYTMQVGSVNVIPQSANHMIVSLNGVIQKPGSSFTVSGSTITFASNLATGDAIDFIQILGDVLDLGTPSDATVTTVKLAADAVTEAKIADSAVENEHLNVNVITGQTAETSIADGDTILIHDDSASALRKMTKSNFVSGIGGANTPSFQARSNSGQSLTNAVHHDIVFGEEIFDTDNAFASNVFTVPSDKAGKYLLYGQAGRQNWDSDRFLCYLARTRSGVTADLSSSESAINTTGYHTTNTLCIADLQVGDVVKVVVYHNSGSTRTLSVGDRTCFQGFKLI